MKILHTADWHARDVDIDEISKCLGFMIDTAIVEKPNVVIVAGDVFDSQNVRLDTEAAKMVFRVISTLADIAPVAVLLGTPSHEGRATEVLHHIRAEYPVLVSTAPEQVYWFKGGLLERKPREDGRDYGPPDAVISMIPQPTKQYFEQGEGDIKLTDAQIAQAMNAIFGGMAAGAASYLEAPHILVGHWNTSGSYISDTQILTGVDIEIHPDQMALANADLVCLGHIHKSQIINPNIFYCGSIYRKTWGELEEKGFYIHEINENREVESRFIKTPTRKLVKMEGDFTNSPIEELDGLFEASTGDAKGANIRIELKVYQDEAVRVDREKIKEFYKSAGAISVDVRLIRTPRSNVRSKNILKLNTLREKIEEMASLGDEKVPAAVLDKADLLETLSPDELIKAVSAR